MKRIPPKGVGTPRPGNDVAQDAAAASAAATDAAVDTPAAGANTPAAEASASTAEADLTREGLARKVLEAADNDILEATVILLSSQADAIDAGIRPKVLDEVFADLEQQVVELVHQEFPADE